MPVKVFNGSEPYSASVSGSPPAAGTWANFREYVYETKLVESIEGGMSEAEAHSFVSTQMNGSHLYFSSVHNSIDFHSIPNGQMPQ